MLALQHLAQKTGIWTLSIKKCQIFHKVFVWFLWLLYIANILLNLTVIIFYTDQLSLINPVNVLQANKVDAQCDKVATVPAFNLPHMHLSPLLGFWVLSRFSALEN